MRFNLAEALKYLISGSKIRSVGWADGEYITFDADFSKIIAEDGEPLDELILNIDVEYEIYRESYTFMEALRLAYNDGKKFELDAKDNDTDLKTVYIKCDRKNGLFMFENKPSSFFQFSDNDTTQKRLCVTKGIYFGDWYEFDSKIENK